MCLPACLSLSSKVEVADEGGGLVMAAPNASGPSDGADDGPADTVSSDEEPVNAAPRWRHRHRRRNPCSEPGHQDGSRDETPAIVHKPLRAKSQPPIGTKEKENRRPSSRLDWTERQAEIRRTANGVSD